MPRFAFASLIAGWALFGVIRASGQLFWSNRLLWGPPILFMLSVFLALAAMSDAARRGPLVAIAFAGFASVLVYGVAYAFLFALVGH